MSFVLVAGGAGYIGSHTVVELVNAGYEPVILDNFCNSSKECIGRLETILKRKLEWVEVDLLDQAALDAVFKKYKFEAVMHFAGLKAVGESTAKPLSYYHVNVTGALHLLEAMKAHGVTKFIFSSSATVYGDPQYLPLDEKHPVGACTNPYGKTKYFIEEICRDLAIAEPHWQIVLLRYFNPIGAHESGLIGEDPQGIPNNLVPFVSQVAVGRRPHVAVYGNDYKTPDGTGVRDYIHVVDLAGGHVAALKALPRLSGCRVYNLGTGKGQSVLEVIKAYSAACGHEVKYIIQARRPGDIASCYADASAALTDLGWKATRDMTQMCADSWRWQSGNPNGFRSASS